MTPTDALRDAAQAVLDRWDSPQWQWAKHGPTADLMAALRAALAAAPGPLTGKYGEVLAPFVALMEAELHANASKGDRPGWLSMSEEVALLEIYWHTAKLSAAVKNKDAALIREHSADVANMAMMLLDVCVGITATPAPSVLFDARDDHYGR